MAWAPDYITTAQYKAWARIGDTDDDTEIAAMITAASRAVDASCYRQFGKTTAETRSYVAVWDRHRPRPAWVVTVDDLGDLTGLTVTVAATSTAVTDYHLEPLNAADRSRPYTRLVFDTAAEAYPSDCDPQVNMSGLWGWAAVPATVAAATKLQTARFLARRDSPLGVAGSPQDGSELRLLARVDPDVELMLRPYRRIR